MTGVAGTAAALLADGQPARSPTRCFRAGVARAMQDGLEAEALPLLDAGARRPSRAMRGCGRCSASLYRKLDDLAPAVAALEKAAALAPGRRR